MVRYLTGAFRASERRWIVVAALVLLPVFFLPVLPVWTLHLKAPQYPEGLHLSIYTNTIRGDVDKINTLNHYVGMHKITATDFKEFTYLPQLLTFFGVMALLAALVNRRWLAILGWLLFTGFAAYMFSDYARWLWHYGHDLDPRAALKLPTFTPPLIGYSKMANFRVWSLPGTGTLLLGFAWLLGPAVFWIEHRAARRAAAKALLAALFLMGLLPGARVSEASTLVPAREGALAAAVARAQPGDTLRLGTGTHPGPVILDRSVVLIGEPGAVLDGGGSGTALEIRADGCRVQNLEVRRSGSRVLTADAGVRILGAARVSLAGLTLRDVLYGIYAERCPDLSIERCALTGTALPGAETADGNGIHLWYCERPHVRNSSATRFADAVYLSFVNGAVFESCRFERNARYGFHTMYCQANRLERNRFAFNLAGCAIMFSNHLEVVGNDFVHNRGPRTYGLLLRDCSDGTFRNNRLIDDTIAAFLDGSNRNRFTHNLIEDNGWGILLFSSCEGNEFAGNAFLNNDYPVALDMRYTSNRFDDGTTGNYWSENPAYDLDGDGIGDVPYSPVSAFAFLSKQYPDLAVLARSPAVAALGVAERVVPALRPSEAVDQKPLLRPSMATAPGTAGDRRHAPPSRAGVALFSALAVVGGLGLRGRRGIR